MASTRSDRCQTPISPALPETVSEAAVRFRAGEDAELAYQLQNREYDEHHRLNEHQRKLVASDIRIAKTPFF